MRPDPRDLLLALACVVEALVEGQLLHEPLLLEQTVAIAMSLGLVLRRVAPGLGLLPCIVGFPLLGMAGQQPFLCGVAAFMILLYSVGAHHAVVAATAWLVVAEFAMIRGELAMSRDVLERGVFADIVFVQVFLLPPWFAGRALRGRRRRIAELEALAEELRREREARARLSAERERSHIAREMHDVLAHTIGVITIQASAGERLADRDPTAAGATFRAIRETGSEALSELRRTLGLVRNGSEPGLAPQPGLRELDALAARARTAGLEVNLHLDERAGDAPRGAQLAAYRIVQEAVTNTLRHAGARQLDIAVLADADQLRIDVRDDGHGCARPADGGHGLVGMRERAALYDGWVEAGPVDGTGFAVRAALRLHT
ncbi:histidine kinase [Solirubrobacter taibaiensis]|nr:histidine kinase [Solirubrobacter taibaiensis]